MDQPGLGHLGVDFPLEVTQEQVVYLEATDPMSFHPVPIPDLDLDGRAVLLRVPDIRGTGGQGGLGSM